MKRVHFASVPHIEEIETKAEDPEMDTDKEPESSNVARVPSFYIGKPLKDYDATNGRVSCFQSDGKDGLKNELMPCSHRKVVHSIN